MLPKLHSLTIIRVKQLFAALKLGILWRGISRFKIPKKFYYNGKKFNIYSIHEKSIGYIFRDVLINDEYGLGRLPNAPSTIIDIGANVGLFTLWAGANFPNARIHCYEPNAKLQPILARNAEQVGAQVYTEGVDSRNGLGAFKDLGDSVLGRCTLSESGDTPMVSLKIAIERMGGWVDLLKIDCEGAEWDILQNPDDLNLVGAVRMEYHLLQENHTLPRLVELFNKKGFKLTQYFPNQSYGVVWFDRVKQDYCEDALINRYVIYGERCSGTNIIETAIGLNSSLKTTWRFGFKHYPKKFSKDENMLIRQVPVVVVVRDPIEWLRSFYTTPWHAPSALRELPFEKFVQSEWWSVWAEDALIDRSDSKYGSEIIEDRDVETGLRYANPLQMRTKKYIKFLEIARLAKSIHVIRLEDYISNPEACISSLLHEMGFPVPARIKIPPGYKGNLSWKRQFLMNIGLKKAALFRRKTKKPVITDEVLYIINNLLNREIESNFGYNSTGCPK